MGNMLLKWFSDLTCSGPFKILLVGLDAAGKSTLLYQIKLKETVSTIPTLGFNVETVNFKNISFTMWDVGGQDRIRRLWHHYYQGTHAVIFMVDSADRERIEEAKRELHNILSADQMREAVLLVFANKQDLPGAMSVSEVISHLDFQSEAAKGRRSFCQASTVTTGAGIAEGMEWLSRALSS